MGRKAVANSCNGCAPGVIAVMSQFWEPGSAPRRRAGIKPALTTLDLPLPLGPTTVRKLDAEVSG